MNIPPFPEDISGDVVRGSIKDQFKKAGAGYIKAVAKALQDMGSPIGRANPSVKFAPAGPACSGDTYAFFAVPGAEKQISVQINTSGIGTGRRDRICLLYRVETTGRQRHIGPNNWACGSLDSAEFADRLDRLARTA